MEEKQGRRRRAFSESYKAEVVELCRSGGRSIGQVARDLDLTETAVRRWVSQAEVDHGERDGLTTAEREELRQLRKENRVLREERDILKRATAFFAFMSPSVKPGRLALFFAAQALQRPERLSGYPPIRRDGTLASGEDRVQTIRRAASDGDSDV